MIHVGVGWMLARVPWGMDKVMERLDPILKWLAIDGFGFHEAYFHFRRYEGHWRIPRRFTGYAPRAFDQGFGRCLWFVKGTSVERITETIRSFDPSRQGDLWSGAGLAGAYAGGVERDNLTRLRQSAGEHWPQLAQGAAFAAEARHKAGNLMPNTENACEILCGLSVQNTVDLVNEAFRALPGDGAVPAYEMWRERVQRHFMGDKAGAA
jgi:hypothetical protein